MIDVWNLIEFPEAFPSKTEIFDVGEETRLDAILELAR